ncbi:MAG: hypothetical protein KIT22_18225, partial [Verrucomicrobiae bacterium]|nr:hypothetical protein [Verrucomicrobiae bacterium]
MPWAHRLALLFWALVAGMTALRAADSLPAEWREQAVGPRAAPLPAGPVWMRAWMQVPDSMAGDSGPDLWRDSMTLTLGSLPGPVEVFLNGRRIISTGDLPSGELRRFKVPKGILVRGAY